ncbi:amino acid adenylation domain-containing protein [Duganella sacchari]|uniref:Phenolphthiocerol/phthiocerol polyketide synthase subunit E n=1 Tax=Duganella sacchari TaxID=551987 RepID=A0A1M7LHX9_9BURK|nr:hybrid non-ribosomal peptide synthetase/type I polyketide synthase [Duganella sacchari]SHM77759.1 amino acid adenylation domain-containing protein [Duganella sacchari]
MNLADQGLPGQQEFSGVEIAIVGMAGRFPGASGVDELWRNIVGGVESRQVFDDEKLRERGVANAALADTAYVKAGMVLDGLDQFDAGFFGYSPREAERLDPQQRVFLETAWHALEHAGYAGAATPALTGVYAGCGSNLYLMRNLLPGVDWAASDIASLLGLMNGNDQGSLATRIAYKLNLRGPAVSVQTACSTSLVAVHMACRSLLNYESDLALAGGVWLNLLQEMGYRHQAGAILSPDGHCRAFDAAAGGTVIGSGAGIVVLKRLDEALRDGDTIHAVIKGSALNNDGAEKMAYSAPSVDGQAEVIQAALAMAGVDAGTIGYVEAHGTGTALGDPVEIAALTQAFRASTQDSAYCAIGSVKTNIGHLDAAAGVTGLIKAALALKHGILPPSLNFEQANPQIDFAASPFYVNTEARPWTTGGAPRRAGVSSFGMGGTNAHVVLEEPPTLVPQPVSGAAQLLLLSARSEEALDNAAAQLADHLERHPAQRLRDVAYTLHAGRRHFAHRALAWADNHGDAVKALTGSGAQMVRGLAMADAPAVAFLFPGQGAQHTDMGRDLYRTNNVMRESVDCCCALLKGRLGLDLRDLLYPAPENEAAAAAQLEQTVYTQPALFVLEYAMAQMWISHGVKPDALLGHSIGEYVAACLAGVFTLEDALTIVAERGRLLQASAEGAMLAVSLAEAQLALGADAGCDVAAVNAADLCVLAGPLAAIEAVERQFNARAVAVRRLHVSRAFHSSLVEPVLAEFEAVLRTVHLQAPGIPFISNLSGDWITDDEARDPAYWLRHMRGTVRFVDGLTTLLQPPNRVLLEVGPGETLTSLARRHPQSTGRPVFATQSHPARRSQNAQQYMQCLAQLWVTGVVLNPSALGINGGRRVALPAYPFERKSYWVVPETVAPSEKPRGMDDWFLHPVWKRAMPLVVADQQRRGAVLILGDEDSFANSLASQCAAQGRAVIHVERSSGFERIAADRYAVRPDSAEDFKQLLAAVQFSAIDVCHLWTLNPQSDMLGQGFYSLTALARALDDAGVRDAAITVITSGMEDVTGTEELHPQLATLNGACKVIPQEYPHISCRLLDVLPGQVSPGQVVAEMNATNGEPLVAYRGAHRWIKDYEPLARPVSGDQRLRQNGVYLITGGAGGVGMILAHYLAQAWRARLVLVNRSVMQADAPVLRELESLGGDVLALQADVSDAEQMNAAIDTARQHFGTLNGIIHAAGVAGVGMIATKQKPAMEKVFAPKVQGTINLLNATRNEPLDFILLCSSLTAITGGYAQADYCAANAFLDALAQRGSDPWLVSVNWDVWRDVGMASGQRLPDGEGITAADAGLLLERILSGPSVPQVLISTIGLQRQIARSASMEMAERLLAAPESKRQQHARPTLSAAYVEPSGALETGLASLWSEFLGITPVGANDNLFELGGDSLLAIQLLAKVRSTYGIELHPTGFFKNPTVAALAVTMGGAAPDGGSSPAIVPRSDSGPASLSYAQQRLWFLWQLDPESAAYHLSGGLGFKGKLNIDALRAALDGLVARHPALRTVFRQDPDGSLYPVVQEPQAVALPYLNMGDEIHRLCAQPFDLSNGPLLRAALLKRGEQEHQLVVVMHHIVSDGYSTQLILDELAQRYTAHVQGSALQLAQLPIAYSDYAAWQRALLAGPEGARQLTWWKDLLGAQNTALNLQTSRPRKADARYGAARHVISLPPELTAGLRRQAQNNGATFFAVLLTAYQALLFRYSGQTDIRVGVPVANRHHAETAGLVGFFVNTQVLPARLNAKTPLVQLLAQTRDHALNAQANQDLPLDWLVDAMQVERNLNGNPLFQVMFNHLRLDHGSLAQWPDLDVERIDLDEQNVQSELSLTTYENSNGQVTANFSYAPELFDGEHIEAMAGHYLLLLQALANQPEHVVGEVELLSERQLDRLQQWGDNREQHGQDAPVHLLFERQAAAQPDKCALLFGDELLSYGELNARANRLTHHLIQLGVRPEIKVGIALERSFDMVIGLLAILKAGGAYVPLDPEYPADRLRYMVEDSRIGLLLTHSQLPGQVGVRALLLDQLDLSSQPAHNPAPVLNGENLAYVIYTSGSTGKPKGAANRHRSLYNRLAWMQQAYQLTSADTVLQKTPFSFDVSVWEFFWPLMMGARLAIAAPGEHREPARLRELICRHQVTTLHFVPSMLQAFMAHDGVAACTSLTRIICSGEALPVEAQNSVFKLLPQAALYNLYGPTEAAIDVTHWTCRADGSSQVPIGQPISQTKTYVLDGDLNLAPAGVAGELYLGGIGLARGYLERPALTSERFVADPFDPQGGRLYRTGDLVRWNSEGQLEYLGRLDHQVKIRGLRIELGEIEAQLLAQPELREAVVVARDSAAGTRLVAYISLQAGLHCETAELRERLSTALPDYMVPGAIVVLDTLPLNANGKIDRKALPEPELSITTEYEAPQNEVEITLAALWRDLLGAAQIGRNDHFFQLGGHSLLAVQLTARIQRDMQFELHVKDVFRYPLLADLARHVGSQLGNSNDQALADLDSFIDSLENV